MSSSVFDLARIVLIDLSLAGDNALVVGMAVAALPLATRHKAMVIGIGAATALRILMAIFAVRLMHVTGLTLAGGILLVWVAWKMARELRHAKNPALTEEEINGPAHKTFSAAVWQIVIADISMSLDNVLGVAGVARDNMTALVAGLGLSVALMAFASAWIARLAARWPKAGYFGIAVILHTALTMIWDGMHTVMQPEHGFAGVVGQISRAFS
jgi:YjbE family integral membrane protein